MIRFKVTDEACGCCSIISIDRPSAKSVGYEGGFDELCYIPTPGKSALAAELLGVATEEVETFMNVIQSGVTYDDAQQKLADLRIELEIVNKSLEKKAAQELYDQVRELLEEMQ